MMKKAARARKVGLTAVVMSIIFLLTLLTALPTHAVFGEEASESGADPETETEEPADEEGPTIADPFEGYDDVNPANRYEAEDGVVTHAVIGNYGSSHSGTGFVGEIDYGDSSVQFTVTVGEEGEYNMLIAYAIGATFQPGTFIVHNDAGYYAQVSCDVITDWGLFTRETIAYTTISLREGENHVTLHKGRNMVQVDFICIGERIGDYVDKENLGTGPEVPEGYTRYEAENGYVVNASCKGAGFHSDYGFGYSGAGFVGNMDDASHYVDIPVTVGESGAYDVNLRYASGSSLVPSYKVCVGRYGENGYLYSYGTVSLPECNGWGEFSESGVATIRVALEAGDSFVRVVPEYDYAELDCIEIGPRAGEYFLGTDESLVGNLGDNVFDDDFFADDDEDGYILLETGCGAVIGAGVPVLSAAAAGAAIWIAGRRKHHEK